MKHNFRSILAVTLAASLAVSGLSYFSTKKAAADEAETAVKSLKTLSFDSTEDIIAVNDSAAKIVSDEERGSVISLGAGDASKAMNGAQITNPWADAKTNPDGAKAYTTADINAAYDYALGLADGVTFRPGQAIPDTGYVVRKPGEGGISWEKLEFGSTNKNSNGDVTDDDETGVNDSAGNYRGAEAAKAAMGDVSMATEAKEKKTAIKRADGQKARVSAYKPEKENEYFRPLWNKEDGLTMSVWVKLPEGTTEDTILFSFFNEREVEAVDYAQEEKNRKTTKFNNKTGHLFVTADGSIEFRELSAYAGDPDSTSEDTQIGRYGATRNHYEARRVGSNEGVNPLKKAGEWVYVTLVCENDYISVYFDGVKVNYIEQGISNMDYNTGKIKAEITDNEQYLQDWDHPELSGKWTTDDTSTDYKEFNARFSSRNTPTYQIVNSGIYSGFLTWSGRTNKDKKATAFLRHAPRITLCQWLQDEGTTLYLGGAAGKDLSVYVAGASGNGQWTYANQYTVPAGTSFDNFEFYGEALTKDEVASAYIAEGGSLDTTPEPTELESPEPTESESPEPTESESPEPTESESPEPTGSESPEPAQSESPEPAQSESPEPAQSESPEPAQSESPEPAQSESPEPAQSESPEPAQSESPEPAQSESPEPAQSESPEPSESAAPERLLGDVTGDGVIDAEDALAVLKHAAQLERIPEDLQWVAKITDDDVIDAEDALEILKYAAQIITEFAAE